MNYFKVLGLAKEPFSNSPDPEFFFQSGRHVSCLQKLEISVRMRRGLNIVMGEVGAGKTTLSRQLIRMFSEDESIDTHLILDPEFKDPIECLTALRELLGLPPAAADTSEWKLKESIQKYLFQKGVDEKKIVVLILDEGQKIPAFFVEILRELLNFEVNEFKLLQIIIFAQKEFQQTLDSFPNFADRANLVHILGPLDFKETRAMIRFRLSQAKEEYRTPEIFSFLGYVAAYRASGGYPRKIIHLCHRTILSMIIQNRAKAGWRMVNWCADMTFPGRPRKWPRIVIPAAAAIMAIMLLLRLGPLESFNSVLHISAKNQPAAASHEQRAAIGNSSGITAPVPKANEQRHEPPKTDSSSLPAQEAMAEVASAPLEVQGPVPEKIAAQPEVQPPISHAPPSILGQVVVTHGETLTQMVQRVCGAPNSQYLKAVAAINPDLKNINKLLIDQTITFPLPAKVPGPGNRPLVQVAIGGTLQEGYELLRKYSRDSVPLKLVSYWNKREGLRFGIFLDGCCGNQNAAASALKDLPPQLAAGGKLVSEWDMDTIFFGRF